MKKFLIVTIIILSIFMTACIIVPASTIEEDTTEQSAQNLPESQDDAPVQAKDEVVNETVNENSNDNANSQPANNNQNNQSQKASDPTPEPTQQFIEDEDQTTAYPVSTVAHDDMLGWWYLTMWNDTDTGTDLIFYEITQSMMNVLPYGDAPANRDMNYTFNNGVVDFGDGAYDVILDQGVLVLVSQASTQSIVFQPVTESEIANIVAANDNSGSPSNAVDTIESPAYSDGESYATYSDHDNISSLLIGSTWDTYAYVYADKTYSKDYLADESVNFYYDYSFTYFGAIADYDGTYGIYDGELELAFDNGTYSYSSDVYIIDNYTRGVYYLFLSDNDSGNPDCYSVYEGTLGP